MLITLCCCMQRLVSWYSNCNFASKTLVRTSLGFTVSWSEKKKYVWFFYILEESRSREHFLNLYIPYFNLNFGTYLSHLGVQALFLMYFIFWFSQNKRPNHLPIIFQVMFFQHSECCLTVQTENLIHFFSMAEKETLKSFLMTRPLLQSCENVIVIMSSD